MKRHFSFGFKALAACAMSAMLAVSCYDDSKLWEEIEGLEERVAALEEKLNTEVSTLNSKLGTLETAYKAGDAALAESVAALTEELDALDGTVDGYIKSNDAALKAAIDELKKADAALADVDTDVLLSLAKLGVVSVEEDKDGKVVITFVDESTLEIANEAGVVTIVDGKWAVVVDGEVTVLDALVHPDTTLDFRVGDDNTLYVSYDGKKTWESTGVVVNDETTFNVVSGYEYNEEEGYLSLTIGGEEYELPIYQPDNSELTFGRSDIYFAYGVSKNVELNNEDIEEFYVMSKPDGWKVALEGTTLTVTAPSHELVELGAGEIEGEVLIHATTVTGMCKVAKFTVKTGSAVSLTYNDGEVTFFSALSTYNPMYGQTVFLPIQFGVATMEEYLSFSSSEDFIKAQSEHTALTDLQWVADMQEIWYEDGVCEEINLTFNITDFYEDFDSEEAYVLWALPQSSSYMYDEAVCIFTANMIEVEQKESFYNDATLSVNAIGADGYYISAVNMSYLTEFFYDIEADEIIPYYLVEGLLGSYFGGGPFTKFQNGDAHAMGEIYPSGASVVNLSDVILSDFEGVDPDNEYSIIVLPYYKNKAVTDYDVEDIRVYTCKTSGLEYDATVKSTVTFVSGYTTLEFTITPPTGGKTKYEYMSYEDFVDEYIENDNLDTDAVLESMSRQSWALTEPYTESVDWNVKPNTKYVVLTYTTFEGGYNIEYHTTTTYATFAEYMQNVPAGATVTLTEDIVLTSPMTITQNLTINLNGYTISNEEDLYNLGTADWSLISVRGNGVVVTIKDGEEIGAVVAKSGDCYAVDVRDGATVNIEGGNFVGNITAVYAIDGSTVNVKGGTYKIQQLSEYNDCRYLLNCHDSSNNKINVTGGTFYRFDPANNLAEGENTCFTAPGYLTLADADTDTYVVCCTPDRRQWVTGSSDLDDIIGAGDTRYVLDFGISLPELYPTIFKDPNTFALGMDYEPIQGPDAAGVWMTFGVYGSYTIEPTSANSGIIYFNGTPIPYSDCDGEWCVFDFSNIFGCTLYCVPSETKISVQPQ